MFEHGGRLRGAAARYGIPVESWLDLSTGINPNGWPVPALPPAVFSRLPEELDGLEAAASAYYGTTSLLPVAGSQAAIQVLPFLRAPCRVSVIAPGYSEHAQAWQRAGHKVALVAAADLEAAAVASEVVVVIYPNNPTGTCFTAEQLLQWHTVLVSHGGWLLVDEAFMDVTPDRSLVQHSPRPGLVILRSLGKFFGLAGLRVGFVCADATLLSALKARLGPWAVTTPSRWIASAALGDLDWQTRTRLQLAERSARLAELLRRHGLAPSGGTALFQWTETHKAASIHERLARSAVLLRLFTSPPSLRFGLPGTEEEWERLDKVLGKPA